MEGALQCASLLSFGWAKIKRYCGMSLGGILILFSILFVVTRFYHFTRVNLHRCKDPILAVLILSSWKIDSSTCYDDLGITIFFGIHHWWSCFIILCIGIESFWLMHDFRVATVTFPLANVLLFRHKGQTVHPVSSINPMSLSRPQTPPPLEITVSVPLLYSLTSSSKSSSEAEDTDNPRTSQRFDLVKYKIPAYPNHGNKSYRSLAVLSDHVGSVSSLALCGEFILSASQGKDIIVWQQPDLRMFTKFGEGDGSVKAVVTVGNKVFSAHQDNRIRVWKVSRRSENIFRLLNTLPTRKDYLGKFMKYSNYVQTRRHHKKLWIEHSDSISCLAVSISNGLVYSGSWDKTLKVWRISDLKCLESIKAHNDAINALVSCKGVVYSASADGKIKAWGKTEEKQSTSHSLKCVLSGHDGVSINAVVVSDDGKWVFGGGSDGFLMGWEGNKELVSWKLVSEMKAHDMSVLCLSIVGEFLCSGSADKSIGIWKRKEFGSVLKVGSIRGHEGPVKCLQASPVSVGDGFMLYSGSLDKSLRVWWVPNCYSSMVEEQDTEQSQYKV